MAVEKTQGILNEQQFNSSPLKGLISYQDYVTKALKLGSAFTVQRLLAMQDAEKTSDKIRNSVKGWQLEKEAEKDAAEEEYYAALAQMKAMKTAQEKAFKRAEEELASFGEDSFRYNDAYKKYHDSTKTYSDAETNWKIAMDKFMSANKVAHNAFFTAQGLN